MLKPFPSNDLFSKGLQVSREQPPGAYKQRVPTLGSFSRSATLSTLRVLITTGRPLNVPLYTLAKPPDVNGVASHLMDFGASANEDGRMQNWPHSFRRDF